MNSQKADENIISKIIQSKINKEMGISDYDNDLFDYDEFINPSFF